MHYSSGARYCERDLPPSAHACRGGDFSESRLYDFTIRPPAPSAGGGDIPVLGFWDFGILGLGMRMVPAELAPPAGGSDFASGQ